MKLESQDSVRKATVCQYSFQHLNPFQWSFEERPVRALDLAYLHGSPAMLIRTKQTDVKLQYQEVFKGPWILFADGEDVWILRK